MLESEQIESNRQLCKQELCNDFENSTWQNNAIFDGDNDFTALVKYRSELYAILGKRRDASMDLIDAVGLSANCSISHRS